MEQTILLSEYLAHRFGKEKIILAGHSWGSIVGLKAAKARPDLYHAYVGVGQQVNAIENDRIGYELVRREARGDKRLLEKLREQGPPPYSVEEKGAYVRLFQKLAVLSPRAPGAVKPAFWSFIHAEEYTIMDSIRLLRSVLDGVNYIYPQLEEFRFAPHETVTEALHTLRCSMNGHGLLRAVPATEWHRIVTHLTFAFQPIVHIHTGETYGFEALLRGWEKAGFSSIQEIFDRAEEDGVLLWLNRRLQEMAEGRFREARLPNRVKLFFNIDNRVFSQLPDGTEEDLFPATDETGERSHWFCVELSERHEMRTDDRIFRELKRFQDRNISVAIDDFGTGFSGLQLLYEANPDIIKIDRFFIADVHEDQTKKLFVTNLVHMAHTMGILVIAEGVESPQEFYTCRAVGCDFVQGYLVQRPQLQLSLLQESYEGVRTLVREDRRRYRNTRERILRWMNYTEPLELGAPVLSVLNRFRNAVSAHFFPVVNELGEPIGILRERDMKNWVYSPFGISLLMNSSYKHEIVSVVSRVPVASIETKLDSLVELYALDPEADAVLLTENGKYRGYLDSRTMVQLIHEREVERARDENPLTRLPGNTMIREYVGERLAYEEEPYLLGYLDFDNFKPFNDLYGFRHGDRVIQLFGDMLKEFAQRSGGFVGHIGGDDFFVALELRSRSVEEAIEAIQLLQRSFQENVLAFYDGEARQQGCIEAEDREGKKRCFSILTVSAGVVILPAGRERRGGEETVLRALSDLKSRAKTRQDHLAFRELSVTMV